jgi:hypothetical protein
MQDCQLTAKFQKMRVKKRTEKELALGAKEI